MRSFVFIACAVFAVTGCDKLRKKHEAEPAAGSGSGSSEPPKVGHSSTKLGSNVGSGSASGSDAGSAAGAAGSAKPGGEHMVGGNGSPAGVGDDGRMHGPGGPVYMGRGVDCDAAHDHCLRDGVWFSVGNITAGKLYRAVPVYEYEKKWFTWRGEPADTPGKLYKTQIAGNAKLAAGTQVIWFSSETSDRKWADTEYDALTTSRWEAGVVESQPSPTVVMIKGWGATPLDTVRILTETREP